MTVTRVLSADRHLLLLAYDTRVSFLDHHPQQTLPGETYQLFDEVPFYGWLYQKPLGLLITHIVGERSFTEEAFVEHHSRSHGGHVCWGGEGWGA